MIRIATKQYAYSSLAFWVIREDNKEEKKGHLITKPHK